MAAVSRDAPIEFAFRDDLAALAREVREAPRLTADEARRMTAEIEAALRAPRLTGGEMPEHERARLREEAAAVLTRDGWAR